MFEKHPGLNKNITWQVLQLNRIYKSYSYPPHFYKTPRSVTYSMKCFSTKHYLQIIVGRSLQVLIWKGRAAAQHSQPQRAGTTGHYHSNTKSEYNGVVSHGTLLALINLR